MRAVRDEVMTVTAADMDKHVSSSSCIDQNTLTDDYWSPVGNTCDTTGSSAELLVDLLTSCQPFDAHCCHVGTAIEHHVPNRAKLSFVIFDIRAF